MNTAIDIIIVLVMAVLTYSNYKQGNYKTALFTSFVAGTAFTMMLITY